MEQAGRRWHFRTADGWVTAYYTRRDLVFMLFDQLGQAPRHRVRYSVPWFPRLSPHHQERIMSTYLRQAVASANGRSAAAVPDDPAFVRSHPAVFEYLTARVWPDGKERDTSTITLFVDSGTWKGSVNDRANSRSAFVSAETFQELFQALEEGLASDDLDWRPHREPRKGKFR